MEMPHKKKEMIQPSCATRKLAFATIILSCRFFKTSNMDGVQGNVIETTFDHKFARDIVRFVLREYMIGLYWIPTGIFKETDLDSPFTPQVKNAVKEELDNEGHTLHKIFDEFFPDKSLVDNNYLEVCRKAKDRFVSEEFEIKSFISFTVLLAFFAGLYYHYGGSPGTFMSYTMIVQAIRELKQLGKIDDNVWNEMQTWLENQAEPVRLWDSELCYNK